MCGENALKKVMGNVLQKVQIGVGEASKLTKLSYLLEGTAQHLYTVVEWQVHQDYVK